MTYLEILLTKPPVVGESVEIYRRLSEDVHFLFASFKKYLSEEEVNVEGKPLLTIVDSFCVEKTKLLKYHSIVFADFGPLALKVFNWILIIREEAKIFRENLLEDVAAQQLTMEKNLTKNPEVTQTFINLHYQDKLAKAPSSRTIKVKK